MSMSVESLQLWLAIATFVVVAIAAGASVYSVRISKAQLSMARRALEPARPLVEVSARHYKNYRDWSVLDISIRNRADTPLDISEVTMGSPKGALLLSMESLPTKPGNQPWEPAEAIDPPPLSAAVPKLRVSHQIGPAGADGEYGRRGSGTLQVLVHLPLSRFHHGSTPKVIIAVRWRNHAAETFAIAAKVIMPNIT